MSSERSGRGRLFIVSAPSGTGKTTLVERLVQVVPDLVAVAVVHVTPRRARARPTGWTIISSAASSSTPMIAAGDFLEFADVFGNYYGTSAGETERVLAGGRDLVLVIDVQGARQVRLRGFDSVGVFVLPPSYAVLEARLRQPQQGQRGGHSTQARGRTQRSGGRGRVRLRRDQRRGRSSRRAGLCCIVQAERARRPRMGPVASAVIDTFRE